MTPANAPRLSLWLFLLLFSATALLGPGSACSDQKTESLLIITLDTVRRDHLPTYGYARDTAPALARLAREGVVFDRAIAQDTNTNPSHASMFTGLYPRSHGAIANGVALPRHITTLAQVLSDRGFATGAVVAGSPMRAVASGLHRGFDFYDDRFRGPRRDGANVVKSARNWLAKQGSEPWFLFVHLYDAHGPYRPKASYANLFTPELPSQPITRIPRYQRRGATQVETDLNDYVARYDAMIRYVDDRIAELIAGVDLDHTLVVVLADHGESLGERFQKLDHGAQVFDEQIRIPLVMRGLGLKPRRIEAPVETVDLMPTLLDLLGIPPPEGLVFEGRTLAPWLRDGGEPPARPVFATARAASKRHEDRNYQLDPQRRIEAVRSGDWKMIRYPGLQGDYFELYDLARDPGERQDRSAGESERLKRYIALLNDRGPGVSKRIGEHEIPQEIKDELRALGYVD